jgi:cobalamin biosynthesis protein CobD/CbiB
VLEGEVLAWVLWVVSLASIVEYSLAAALQLPPWLVSLFDGLLLRSVLQQMPLVDLRA